MKLHIWERIEHRLHRHEHTAAPAAGETPATHLGSRGRERIRAWLNGLKASIDRSDKSGPSRPH
jgi:hypothetical protein